MWERGQRSLSDLLTNILIRRTRNHILRWYGTDAESGQPVDPTAFGQYMDGTRRAYVTVAGKPQFFPRRELETIEYSIEDTYQGLYAQLLTYFGQGKTAPGSVVADELSFARYGLWHYVVREKQGKEPYLTLKRAGANLRRPHSDAALQTLRVERLCFPSNNRTLNRDAPAILVSTRKRHRPRR